MENSVILSINDAARKMGITRQAVYIALKKGPLKGFVKGCRWFIHLKDLEHYQAFKYSREYSKDANGNLIYDKAKGYYSPLQAANLFRVPLQRIYYLLRMKYLKSKREGSRYVIHIDDLKQVQFKVFL